MPQTRSLVEVRRFCEAVTAAGGEIPAVLGHLLVGADLVDGYSATQAPITNLVEQLASGKMTSAKLTTLVETAAHQQMVANFIGGLRPAVEPAVVARFHRELKAGAADEILDSLRGKFDEAAAAIADTKAILGSGESSIEHMLNTSDRPADVAEAWRSLPRHLAVVTRVAAIASMFGCRQTALFPLVKVYGPGHNELIDDRAIAVTEGGLVGDSAALMRPDQGGTTSPFYRCSALRLHSIAEAQQRYDDFASTEFDRVHASRARGGHIDEGGVVVYDEPPVNPFRPLEV